MGVSSIFLRCRLGVPERPGYSWAEVVSKVLCLELEPDPMSCSTTGVRFVLIDPLLSL